MPFEPRPALPIDEMSLPADYLQALGFATAAWNVVRRDLFALFAEVCDADERMTQAILGDTKLEDICHRIHDCALLRSYPRESLKAIEHSLAFLEICRENRTYFEHAPHEAGRGPSSTLDAKTDELHRLGRQLWLLRGTLATLTEHLASLSTASLSVVPLPAMPPLPGLARQGALDRLKEQTPARKGALCGARPFQAA